MTEIQRQGAVPRHVTKTGNTERERLTLAAAGVTASCRQPCAVSGWLSRRWLPLGSRTAASLTP
jgi:hypothetical protein